MDIADAVTTEYLSFDQSTRVSKLVGAFTDREERVVVVTGDDGEFEGVVTQRQLLATKHDPDERISNVMRDDPPRVERDEDVRETARLMVESELKLLPVFEADEFVGVVTARDLAEHVLPHLDALDVDDVYTQDLITVEADANVGTLINLTREHGISRVPVVAEDEVGGKVLRTAEGLVSIYDLVDFVVRATEQTEGGMPAGFDNHGGSGSREGYRSHPGYGDRSGDETPLINIPARDVMTSPVATATPGDSLEEAVREMLEKEYRSLVVIDENEEPVGIVTLTDVMRALTWTEDEEETPLQIFGIDLLTGMSRGDIADIVEEIDGKYADMDVIEAYVVLQKHQERHRGMPLVRATIRLFTDKGRFAGTGEEYGADPAIREARDNLERNVLDEKEYNRTRERGRRTEEEAERMLGWWLEA